MSTAWHCDNDTCGTWTRKGADSELRAGWLVVLDDGGSESHLCSTDCLLAWAAGSDPLEVTLNGPPSESEQR